MQNELAEQFYQEQKRARYEEVANIPNLERPGDMFLKDLPVDIAKYILQYHDGSPSDMETTKKEMKRINRCFVKDTSVAIKNYPRNNMVFMNQEGPIEGGWKIFRHFRNIREDKVEGYIRTGPWDNSVTYEYEY